MVKTANPRTTTHEQFTIERTYDAAPAVVFAAWADVKAKQEWWGGPDGWKDEHRLDFRIGGREWQRTTSPDGAEQFTFNGEYLDIVPDERIVYAYTMDHRQRRLSASLTTLEFRPAGDKTTLVLTEADVLFDDKMDGDDREGGSNRLLNSLERYLKTNGS
jgi:uncharacterized protein YndB with AHSA1/START domain